MMPKTSQPTSSMRADWSKTTVRRCRTWPARKTHLGRGVTARRRNLPFSRYDDVHHAHAEEAHGQQVQAQEPRQQEGGVVGGVGVAGALHGDGQEGGLGPSLAHLHGEVGLLDDLRGPLALGRPGRCSRGAGALRAAARAGRRCRPASSGPRPPRRAVSGASAGVRARAGQHRASGRRLAPGPATTRVMAGAEPERKMTPKPRSMQQREHEGPEHRHPVAAVELPFHQELAQSSMGCHFSPAGCGR